MKFSVKDFFSKCDQIHNWIWSHLLKKSLMKNFIFCAVIKVPNKIIVESKKNHLAKKIATLQCFWIKILSGGSFHE